MAGWKLVPRGVRQLAIGAAVLLVFALAAETGVRVWAPQELISDVVVLGGPVCHRLEPNARGVQRSREYAVDIVISDQGLRDHHHPPKNEQVFRILVLGDSHTFGWGVSMEEAFPSLLEHELNAQQDAGLTFEVINTGTMGYGTGHQRQFLDAYGYSFEPDLVVVVVDLLHDIVANNQRFTINDGRPERNATPCVFEASRSFTAWIPFAQALRGHSHAFRFFGTAVTGAVRTTGRSDLAPPARAVTERYDLRVTRAIFQKLATELSERGVGLAVVILPEFITSEPAVLGSFETFLAEEGMHFLSLEHDIGPAFYPSQLTFETSPHFNAYGHRVLAQRIHRFLESTF